MLRLTEAVAFAFVHLEDMRRLDAGGDALGLSRRDDVVLVALEDQQRRLNILGVVERRPIVILLLGLGELADEAFGVMEFELPSGGAEAEEVGDAVKGGAAFVDLGVLREDVENGETAGGTARDQQTARIR